MRGNINWCLLVQLSFIWLVINSVNLTRLLSSDENQHSVLEGHRIVYIYLLFIPDSQLLYNCL